MLEIAGGGLRATLLAGPYLSVISLRAGERELLLAPEEVPAPYRVHDTRAGLTLLHPWANRLGAGRFEIAGRELRLAAEDPDVGRDQNGLSIHGLAHPEGWELTRTAPDAACATATWSRRPAFPFDHRVEVSFQLTGRGELAGRGEVAGRRELSITTKLVSEETPDGPGAAPVPIAFGWHPYFRCERTAETKLSLPARRHVALDERGLPTGEHTEEPAATVVLGESELAFDDAFSGLPADAVFTLRDRHGELQVRHQASYRHAQVFAPTNAPVVSLEPMTAPVDALCTGEGLRMLAPGESLVARFSVRHTPSELQE